MPRLSRSKVWAPPPLAVYVHLPWCLAKCPYCDFNSHVAPANLPQDIYVERLLGDLDLDAPQVADREVQSVFFGGGTPSLFAPQSIGRILSGIAARLPVGADVEVTLEANPGALEYGHFADYRAAGVTRISLGVQSFDDAQLTRLGRIHRSGDVFAAVEAIRAGGFDNFNLDLMYGLPEQTLSDAEADLRRAIELGPTHVSQYQLTLEPGTVFFHRPPPLPDDDLTWDMQLASQELLAGAGYGQYEVSAYARDTFQCRHNRNYWQFGDYLGLGAGAHGKLIEVSAGRVFRTLRCKQPREYLTRDAATRRIECTAVPETDLPFEFTLNALRLNEGFTPALFTAHTGLELETVQPALDAGQARNLLEHADGTWRATRLGRRFLNDLQALFLPG